MTQGVNKVGFWGEGRGGGSFQNDQSIEAISNCIFVVRVAAYL